VASIRRLKSCQRCGDGQAVEPVDLEVDRWLFAGVELVEELVDRF
jgi:hypothetical protein